MSTYAIKWLKDKLGNRFFPITHTKAVRDDNNTNLETLLAAKQDELVSAVNIKTINGNSILGSGNMDVSGGGGGGQANVIESISVNSVAQAVDANKNVDLQFKTVNNNSLSGTGNISIATGENNVIESISVNTVAQTVTNKNVDITVPTKVSDLTNDSGYTTNTGTITSVKMNGTTVSSSGEADLGTVITSHQDISGKADKSATVSTVTYNTTSKKITKTINGTTTDVVTAATIVTDGGGITTETDPTVPSWAKASSKPSYTASEVGAVPTTRTVNGKALSADITLSASDVSALPSSTSIPTALSDLSDDATHRVVTDTEKTTWSGKQDALTFDGTYNASTNKAATVSTVTNAINALDGGTIGTGGAGKTITSLSQSNGNVSATFSDISITKSQVSDFPTSMTPASHTHGNISNTGTLTDTAAAAAGNDYVVIRDASDAKIQTSTIKGTDVADAVSKKHSHSTLTLSTSAQAYDGTHTLALPASDPYTSARTPSAHNQASETINAMTGYTKGSSAAAVAATDTLNAAISKLENQIDTKTSNTGTITGINMNGASKGTSGVVDLGTVITAHQDISGKADKATTLAGYGITDAASSSDLDGYLPLTGGTLTGALTINGNTNITGGNLYLNYAKAVVCKDVDGNNRSILYISDSNRLHLGHDSATNGIDTYINGNNIYLRYGTSHTTGLTLDSSGNTTCTGSVTASSFIGDLTGNASTATTLETSRTIWGRSFDGSANITGAITGATTGSFSSNVTVGGILYFANGNTKGVCFRNAADTANLSAMYLSSSNLLYIGYGHSGAGGSTVIAGNTIELRYGTSRTTGMTMTNAGKLGIGVSAPDEMLHVNGNVKCTSVIQTSDQRLKDKVGDVSINIEDIAAAPNVTFKWKEGEDTESIHGGTYAQYWEKITPYYVHGEKGDKSLEYSPLSLSCSIQLAKEIVTLKEENAQQKKELAEIKELINKLIK